MVSIAGTQNRHVPTGPVKPAGTEAEAVTSPGKSGQSVGHLAKAEIAARGELGDDLAPNALGQAAARIAKMTFEQRAALLVPAAEPEPAPDPTTGTDVTPDPTTRTETPDPTAGTETLDPATETDAIELEATTDPEQLVERF